MTRIICYINNASYNTYCGASGLCREEDCVACRYVSTYFLLNTTCPGCIAHLAEIAGLSPTTPIEIIHDKLEELKSK